MDKRKTNDIINVVPDSIFFRDVAPGESDSVELWIHNIGKKPLSIRIKMPGDSPFSLSTSSLPMTAPGLEAKITVSYTAKSDTPISSKLFVCSEDCNILVPITAIPPCPRVTPETTHINLGPVGLNTEFKFSILLSNMGVTEGRFTLSSDEETLVFTLPNGTVEPSKTLEIGCSFKPQKEGNFSFSIKPEIEGAFEPCPPIEVSYSCAKQSLSLTINSSEISEIDFGTIYFGQKKVIAAVLTNTGPFKQSFVVFPQKNQDDPTETSKSIQNETQKNVFSAIPSEGLLGPNESATLRFVFNPPSDKSEEDSEMLFNQYMTIETVETLQKIEFQMTGKAVHHLVSLSSIDFNFDKIPFKQKSVQNLAIQNQSQFLNTSFEIRPVAHFRFEPSKGTIKANQSASVNVIFFPKSLGSFEVSTIVTFCDGLSKRRINLNGLCGDDDKPFKRIPVYETDQETRFNAMHPDTRFGYDLDEIKKNKEKRAQNDAYLVESEAKRAVIMKKREINNRMKKDAELYLSRTVGHYTKDDVKDFIQTKMADEDFMKRYSNDEEENSVQNTKSYRNNKMADNGLIPPDPPLRRKVEPFRVQNPSKFGLISDDEKKASSVLSMRKEFQDENILIKKKFKAKATTPSEISETTKALTPAQQLMVKASHQTLNFGQVSVFSKQAKSFSVLNNLQQNILVSLKNEYDELKESSPASQIIPSGQIGGFDIRFSSDTPQYFMKTIQYTINGHHTYAFNVSAQVIPIDVQLSSSTMEFRFSPDSTFPVIKEFVTLYNKSNSIAEYYWSNVLPPFYIENSSGSIGIGKSTSIEITYHPGVRSHDEANLVLNVDGGKSQTLKCIGVIGNPKCSLLKKTINFGLIPIGIEKSLQMKVKNSSEDDAMFTISIPSNSPELRIQPKNGRIRAKDFLQFQINYKSISSHKFDIPVTLNICGSQPLIFNVTGESELPDVQISNTEFEFGRVNVGSSSSIDSSITNCSQIPAILILDLSNHPEFRIEFESNLSDELNDKKNNSISLVSDQTFVTRMEGNRNGDYLASISSQEKNKKEKGLIYEINLSEQSSIDFKFIFQPTKINDHSFEFPMSLLNIISSSAKLQPIVSAEGIKAPVIMSTTIIDFGINPIHDPLNPNCPPSLQEIKLTSESKTAINWRIELNSNEDIFSIKPSEGELNPSRSVSAKIHFTPNKAIPYNSYLSLFVVAKDKEKSDNLIGKVQLLGVGSSEMFRPSFHEICMPIVPINTTSQMVISIVNVARIQSFLKVQIPVNENAFPVKITFPEGNQLLHTTETLPLNISFCSDHPLSFTTVVAITDDLGNASSFILTCTCDNSIFTLYPYLSNPNITTKSSFLTKDFLDSSELQSRFLTCSDLIELKDKDWKNSFSPMMISFFQRYLNSLVLNTPLNYFPDDLIESQGMLVIEAVNNLVGNRKVQWTNINNKKNSDDTMNESITTRRNSFKQLLSNLQSLGALLSSIRPEFLMAKSDFLQLMKTKITKQILGIDYFGAPEISSFDQKVLNELKSSKSFSSALLSRLEVLETVYDTLSVECWMTVITQLVKLFVIGRVDPDKMSHISGYQEAFKQAKALFPKQPKGTDILSHISKASNTNSAQELALLKWISVHYIKSGGVPEKLASTFEPLKDSIEFSYLVKSHSSMFNAKLNENASHPEEIESNAVEFLNALKKLQISFIPKPDEIVDGSQCILATIAEYFSEILPHYLPTTVLEFNTSLHKTVSKAVSLTNPSKNEIIYTGTIEGDSSFVLPQDIVTVGPGQTVDFMVNFLARTIRKVTGRLILIPSRPRAVIQRKPETSRGSESALSTSRSMSISKGLPLYSVPVVVDITSSVSVSGSDETINIETNVYSPKSVTIPVKNYFGINGISASIYIKVDKIADENGKQINSGLTKNISGIIESFINNPAQECQQASTPASSKLDDLIASHNAFIVRATEIVFDSDESSIDLEFVPIDLGTYRCLILFKNENQGEFVYEVTAKSILPNPTEFGGAKVKAESGKSIQFQIPVDIENQNLLRALAHSIMKNSHVPDWKFKDLVNKKVREFESEYRKHFELRQFSVISSSQYFEFPSELEISKSASSSKDETAGRGENALKMTFKPTKPGEYPCKVALLSSNDVRVFQVKGIGLQATKEVILEFSTAFGKVVHQDVPVSNNSDDHWQLKINISGDPCFTCPAHLSVKPRSVSAIAVSFSPSKIGTFTGEMTVYNQTKESTTVYKLSATADEPPAEEKIVVECQARQEATKSFVVKHFVRNGKVDVSSTVPILQCAPDLTFRDGEDAEFKFTLVAPRSGVTAGTVTFTDPQTNNYVWYVIEVHVDSPPLEGTIDVSTTARKSVTVDVPVENPHSFSVKYRVAFSDDDLHGPSEFVVPPSGTKMNYPLLVAPARATRKSASVHFFSDDGAEFWYLLNIDVAPPLDAILAPLSAPIGKTASVFVQIENQTPKTASFRVENENAAAFQVVSKKVVTLAAHEKRKVELVYTPTAVGVKESTRVSFKSADVGDYEFALTGTGKPPQPPSPTIVAASPNASPNSALILFANPFIYPARFSVSLAAGDVFQLLIKKKVFTLAAFREECQIPFTFAPREIGQFTGHIIVSSLGPARGPLPELESMPQIRWVFPIIGNATHSGAGENHQLKTKSQVPVEQEMSFTLVGENDAFKIDEYKIELDLEPQFEFVRQVLDMRTEKIEKVEKTVVLTVKVFFSPQRPFKKSVGVIVRNPIAQEWRFSLEICVDLGKPCETIVVESLLNKVGSAKVKVPALFREKTPFHAYFAPGSASELALNESHGIIEQSQSMPVELPVEIVFAPKMYGKILKGLLVVDTLDAQFLFDVIGKTPDYVPPVAKKSSIEDDLDLRKLDVAKKKKRNIIKENIENVKITRPRLDQK